MVADKNVMKKVNKSVDHLSKSNRQQVVDEIRQQVADQLEMLNAFDMIAIKRVFLQYKTQRKCS